MNMNNMIKIGINGITKSGEKYISSKELKLSIGEIVSARVEKGGSGEAKIKIKGYEIDAKGAKEFKNGEVLSLVIKGMENGKLLVEDLKSENIKHDVKSERTAIETAKLKDSIIKEIVEQKGKFSSEKLEKIVENFYKIETEIKKKIEGQTRKENKSEIKNDKEIERNQSDKIIENIEENKIKESINKFEKKEINIEQSNSNDGKGKIILEIDENKSQNINKNDSDINKKDLENINNKINLKNELNLKTDEINREDIISNGNNKIYEKTELKIKVTVEENKSKENREQLKESKIENRESISKENIKEKYGENKNELKENKVVKESNEKVQSEKIKSEESMDKPHFYISTKTENIKQNNRILNERIKKELAEKYKLSEKLNISESENIKKPAKEIAEFIMDKKLENFKSGIIKSLVKLENAETGLNPEIFKKVFEFYEKDNTTFIDEDENSESLLKNYIKELSEGKDIKSESTTIVNVLNKMDDKNIIEFMINSNLLKNAAEIKIKSEENRDKNDKKNKVNYITINLELEKIGKMTVSVVLSEKNRANLSFYVSQEKIKDNIKSDESELKNRFAAKGISVENINIKDLKEEEENRGINCKI
jgi:hypothetical protein